MKSESKSSSTKDILGRDTDTYQKWIEYQRSPDMKWSNIEIDQVNPISLLDASKDEEMRKAFNWKNTQLLLEKTHQHEGIKFNFPEYRLQINQVYQFFTLNDKKGYCENIHQSNVH